MGLMITIIVFLLALFLGSSLWIGVSLYLVGLFSLLFFTNMSVGKLIANVTWNSLNSPSLMAIPLFIFMGEILFRSNLSKDLFKGLAPWMKHIPGGLMHVNVVACTIFAAVCGSTSATAATVGEITIPELEARGYDKKLSIGTVASAGTLGILIPPSLTIIIYGVIANESIGQLFVAGIFPGLLIALSFGIYVMLISILNPNSVPPFTEKYRPVDYLLSLIKILPVFILIMIILGSIYLGWATPSEAAAVGVVISLFFALLQKSINISKFIDALKGTVKISAMILLIICGATYLTAALGSLAIPYRILTYITTLNLSPFTLILILVIIYVILGCLIDGISIIVMTSPIVLPLVKFYGFDTLWFGIFVIILICISNITPPLGFNLFILMGITKEDLLFVAKACLPFFIIMIADIVILYFFPGIVTFLPHLMIQ